MATADHPPRAIYRAALDRLNWLLPRRRWADDLYAKLSFFIEQGRWMSEDMRFCDYMLRYYLSDAFDDPLIARTTCKVEAKAWLAETFGEKHVVPTLAVLESSADIDAFDFPDHCVLKGTAASGQYMCKMPGEPVDRAMLKRWIRTNHYDIRRERHYKGLRNRIIVEPVVGGEGLKDDLKFNVWNGKTRWAWRACVDPEGERRCQVYDLAWNKLAHGVYLRSLPGVVPRPDCFDEMVEAAAKVGSYFDLVRVDLFYEGRDWWFGEITHFNGAAGFSTDPLEAEGIMNTMTFGDAAFTGPFETRAALGAKGPAFKMESH